MNSEKPLHNERASEQSYCGKIALLFALILVWIVLDQLSKSFFSTYNIGESAGTILAGLIDLRLVHNTGAAWGIFAGNPNALGILSLVVCVVLLVYFFLSIKSISYLQIVGIGLIVGGGIGNAIDRFTQGYVTDFFATTFMDFPVFNIADIGVTCGVVLFLFGVLLAWHKENTSSKAA